MSNTTTTSAFVLLPTGDAMRKALIGACSHYKDHGLMILNNVGEKLLWVPEPDNAKAAAMRDEIVNALIS